MGLFLEALFCRTKRCRITYELGDIFLSATCMILLPSYCFTSLNLKTSNSKSHIYRFQTIWRLVYFGYLVYKSLDDEFNSNLIGSVQFGLVYPDCYLFHILETYERSTHGPISYQKFLKTNLEVIKCSQKHMNKTCHKKRFKKEKHGHRCYANLPQKKKKKLSSLP